MIDTAEFRLINEKLPHIAPRLTLFWGYPEFVDYINRMLLDARDGHRQGFPKDCAKALHALIVLHEQTFPHLMQQDRNQDVWSPH